MLSVCQLDVAQSAPNHINVPSGAASLWIYKGTKQWFARETSGCVCLVGSAPTNTGEGHEGLETFNP